MHFKNLHNIQSSFIALRLITILVVVFSSLLCGYTVYSTQKMIAKEREKVYVLDNGKSLILALQQDVNQNRPVEMRSHAKLFHELFFNLSPDKEAIEYNINRALQLSDGSVYNMYNDLSEAGYYSRLIATNTQQKIYIDSMDVDYNDYPYRGKVFATLYIIRESNITTRNLHSSFLLSNVTRSDNNPHGFLLEHFKIYNNSDLETQKK